MVPLDRLADLPPFATLPTDVRALLAERLTPRPFKTGEALFTEGQAGDALYFVAAGRVSIQKILDRTKGTSKSVSVMGPGDFFGEMALLEREPRSASAVAVSDGEALTLSAVDFGRCFSEDSRVALKFLLPFLTTLSARLRETTREMTAFFEVGRVLVQDLGAKELAGRLLEVMVEPFEGEIQAAFFLWEAFSSEYEGTGFAGGWPEKFRDVRLSTDPVLYWMAEKKECLLSPDWEADARFASSVREVWPAFRSLLGAPVPGIRRPMGFLVLGHAGAPGYFTAGHRRTLASVANLVAPAFENAAQREERRAEERLHRARLNKI